VTLRKIAANRKNATRSSGPRTEGGKRNSRFNAVTLGLFAKHVVIPVCDGYKPEKEFQSLLDGLHQDFEPVGFYEEWLVVKVAECMWRLRRATRCESGSVRGAPIWTDRRDNNQLIESLRTEIWVLTEAEEQLRDTGTLSQKTYEQVVPLVEEEKNNKIQSEKDDRRVETDFDREVFSTCIMDRKESLNSMYSALSRSQGDKWEARFDFNSLLPEHDMDRVLRYEEKMQRQIDWALQRLSDSQERRRTLRPSADAAPLLADQNAKRSQ
jgi:hypothetical protein